MRLGDAVRRADLMVQTVRWLKPAQIAARLLQPLRPMRVDLRPAPSLAPTAQAWSLERWRLPAMIGPDRFAFLGQDHDLGGSAGWNDPARDRLWLYNLHYFDDLDAAGARQPEAQALIGRWIAENPPPRGVGWEPYCLSLRIVNWIRAHWRGEALTDEALDSLAAQLRALESRPELRLLGNHLWANAKALAFGGLMFEGAEAERWLAAGAKHVAEQLREQVLADGGHFERSPMYHNIVTADVLDLIEAARVVPGRLPRPLVQALEQAAGPMLAWAEAMTHPDGEPAFFNDSAMGVAPPTAVLIRQAVALGLASTTPQTGLRHLAASGYVRADLGRAVLIADVGEVGPDYIPAHAHADTLSFELTLDGRRVLVNGGISTYEAGPRRQAERGTAAHNTVTVDGANSSQVWGAFRVARRARPLDMGAEAQGDAIEIRGAHDGYRRQSGGPIHRRRWRLTPRSLDVEDRLEGRAGAAVAHWRCRPGLAVAVGVDGVVVCRDATGMTVLEAVFEGGRPTVREGLWSPGFGRSEPAALVEVALDGPCLVSRWRWPD